MGIINFDHAAGNPVDKRVIESMLPYLTERFGNPSSIYSSARSAYNAMEEARGKVAELVGAKPEEVIFTSGATESINLALKGFAYRNRSRGNHIITTEIEHISVLTVCKHLSKQGFKITYAPVDKYGLLKPENVEKLITDETILISVQYANGEIGTIEPVQALGRIAHDHGIALHADGVAAAGKVPIDVRKEEIDLMTLSSNDLYGPKGMGALYVREGVKVEPIIHGGGQERGLRSGTENIPGIVGLGKAAEIARCEMNIHSCRMVQIRDRLIAGLTAKIEDCFLNGHPTIRLPDNANVRLSYVEGESLLLNLDMIGIQAATGSACTSKTLEPSHVLLALGISPVDAQGSLSLTLGRENTMEEAEFLIRELPAVVERLRAMSPLAPKKV